MRDHELLAKFSRESSEDAFRELVRRYAGLVYGIALRRTGDRGTAEEISQNTFAILARKANALRRRAVLAGWLMKTARLEAAKAVRTEYRRRRKMEAYTQEAEHHAETNGHRTAGDEAQWRRALPHLDDALGSLRELDQTAIVLHYYRGKTYREIGTLTGRSEEGVRKRVTRAMEKLGKALRKKGVAVPAAALATGMATEFAKAQPAATQVSLAESALAAAPEISTSMLITNTIQTMAYGKSTTAAAALVAVAAVTLGIQWDQSKALARKVASLEHEYAAAMSGDHRGEAQAPPDGRVVANVAARPEAALTGGAEEITWEQLIDIFGKMNRFGSDAIRDLFFAKLRALDEAEQFMAADLPGVRDELVAAGAPDRMVQMVADVLAMVIAGRRDPEGVANLVIDSDDYPSYRINTALEHWAKSEPDAALEWYQTKLEEGAFRPKGTTEVNRADGALAKLLAGIAQTDLPKAVEHLRTVPEEVARGALYRAAFELNQPEDRQALLDLLDNHTDARLWNQAIDVNAQALIESQSPAAAWQFLGQHLDGQAREEVMAEALFNEIDRDPQAGPKLLEWIATNPEPFRGSKVVNRAVGNWKLYNRRAAEAWLSEHGHAVLGSQQ